MYQHPTHYNTASGSGHLYTAQLTLWANVVLEYPHYDPTGSRISLYNRHAYVYTRSTTADLLLSLSPEGFLRGLIIASFFGEKVWACKT